MAAGSLGVVPLELDGLRARALQLIRTSRNPARCLQSMRAKVSSFLKSGGLGVCCSESSKKRGHEYASPPPSMETHNWGSEPVQVEVPISYVPVPIKGVGSTMSDVMGSKDAEMAIEAEDTRSADLAKEDGEAGFMTTCAGDKKKKARAVEKCVLLVFADVYKFSMLKKLATRFRTVLRATPYGQFEIRGGFDPGPGGSRCKIVTIHKGEVKTEESLGDLLKQRDLRESNLDNMNVNDSEEILKAETSLFVMPMAIFLFMFNKTALYCDMQAMEGVTQNKKWGLGVEDTEEEKKFKKQKGVGEMTEESENSNKKAGLHGQPCESQ